MKLYQYQTEGVQFLVKTRRALLCDDMGVGKTCQAVVACRRVQAKRVLVICPNSVKWFWELEFNQWAPQYRTQVVEGGRAARISQINSGSDVVIIHFEGFRIQIEDILRINWDTVIIDEAHRIKNRRAKVTKSAFRLSRLKSIQNLYLLTGTPILNRPDELWSLLRVLFPEKREYRSYWRFVGRYCFVFYNGFAWEVGNLLPGMAEVLKRELKAFCLRRLKSEVLKELPKKTIQQIWLEMPFKQKKIYREMVENMYVELSEKERVSAAVVIAQITRLKQILIDPRLMVEEPEYLRGVKVNAVTEILEGIGEQKVVIFSQFAKAIRSLANVLSDLGYDCEVLTGNTRRESRDRSVRRFQEDPQCKVFLATIQVGGQGLTLTAASIAIFLDKAWVPAINTQAQDRLHRIGQKLPVTIVELLVKETIEEKIEKLLLKKMEVFEELFQLGRSSLVVRDYKDFLFSLLSS